MIYDTLIIGGGASGLYAASQIRSGRIALLESNSQIGAKLAVSGGGRCNVTNAELAPHHYDGDAAFIQSVLRQYDNRALLADLQKGGVETTLRESVVPGQYFCRSSSEILHYLERSIRHVDLFLKSKVVDLERPLTSADRTAHFQITTQERQFFARRLLLATGGPSYPQLGASSFGQELLQKWGHSVSRLHPALVGFTLMPPERWMCELSGLSTPVEIGVDGQKIGGASSFLIGESPALR